MYILKTVLHYPCNGIEPLHYYHRIGNHDIPRVTGTCMRRFMHKYLTYTIFQVFFTHHDPSEPAERFLLTAMHPKAYTLASVLRSIHHPATYYYACYLNIHYCLTNYKQCHTGKIQHHYKQQPVERLLLCRFKRRNIQGYISKNRLFIKTGYINNYSIGFFRCKTVLNRCGKFLERRFNTQIHSRKQQSYADNGEHYKTIHLVKSLTAHENHEQRHQHCKHECRLKNEYKECSHSKLSFSLFFHKFYKTLEFINRYFLLFH